MMSHHWHQWHFSSVTHLYCLALSMYSCCSRPWEITADTSIMFLTRRTRKVSFNVLANRPNCKQTVINDRTAVVKGNVCVVQGCPLQDGREQGLFICAVGRQAVCISLRAIGGNFVKVWVGNQWLLLAVLHKRAKRRLFKSMIIAPPEKPSVHSFEYIKQWLNSYLSSMTK